MRNLHQHKEKVNILAKYSDGINLIKKLPNGYQRHYVFSGPLPKQVYLFALQMVLTILQDIVAGWTHSHLIQLTALCGDSADSTMACAEDYHQHLPEIC